MLIAAGLYLLLGYLIGFFTVTGALIIWLALYKLQSSQRKGGLILLVIGALMLFSQQLPILIAILLLSLGYFYLKSNRLHKDQNYVQKHNVLESIRWDNDPWELKSMSSWSIIGEIKLDFSLAMMEKQEVTIILQGIVGDIDIIVPEDLPISVSSSILIGQAAVNKQQEKGVMNKIEWQSANYETSETKVKILVSYIVGDMDIKVL